MTHATERRLLQLAVALGGLVPVGAGLAGVLAGPAFVEAAGDLSADSHFRYLSGLLLGIGLIFWASIPAIERHGTRFAMLGAAVFIGGMARLGAAIVLGLPDGPMCLGLAMELIVTPMLCLWQRRISRRPGGRVPS